MNRERSPDQEAGTAGPANPEDVNLNERCITYGVPWLVAVTTVATMLPRWSATRSIATIAYRMT